MSGIAAAVASLPTYPSSAWARAMSYERGLAARFNAEDTSLSLMAMAQIGGFGDRIPAWLKAAQETSSRFHSHFFAPQALQRIFDALLTGDVGAIERALQYADVGKLDVALSVDLEQQEPSTPAWLDYAIRLVAAPLVLLGRAELLPLLHDNSLRRLGPKARSDFTVNASLALAEADEWDHALRILMRARDAGAGIPIDDVNERLLWKYAYLYRRVDTVMPVLADMPFSPREPHLVEYRKWELKAYQIRAGRAGDRIPVITGPQPHGYESAVAMQIAALADDPAAADYVEELRRIVRPRTLEVIHVDRNLAFSTTNVPGIFSVAEAQIAARRKDYKGAAALARLTSTNLLDDPPNDVIDAFLDEGDWRGAVTIAQVHDPRKQPVLAGFDDTRVQEYIELYDHLAVAAARDGEDAAAEALIATAKAVDRAELRDGDGARTDQAYLWLDTLLAGLAESRLPRKYLYVLTPAFRSAY